MQVSLERKNIEEFYSKNGRDNCFYVTTKGLGNYSEVNYPDEVFIFFGKETAGLPADFREKSPEIMA